MREWIVTNGLGGYASLTHNLNNTRKYHGLLVSSLNPPSQRWVFVANMNDRIICDGKTFFLPDYKPIFNFENIPTFIYKINGISIIKSFVMQHGKNTTIIKYDVHTDEPFTIVHQPIVNSRHIYDCTTNRYLNFKQDIFKDILTIKPDNTAHCLKIFLKNSEYEKTPYWEEYYYPKDKERYDSWIDNNLRTGKFIKKIDKNIQYYVILTTENQNTFIPARMFEEELKRRQQIIVDAGLDERLNKLVLSADSFIVNKGNGKSIIAGYHWFSDWGRDTLISLPGLTLVTKRFEEARLILASFSKYCKNGLIPNVFMERDSEPSYNTVDASLWFIDRVFKYYKYTDDLKFIEKNWSTMDSIINSYKNGTDYDIYMDDDYLISHGPGLTWMDVKINDYYPTPRSRKAVEIQALWYNALRVMSYLSQLIGKKDDYFDLSEKVKNSFNKNFTEIYDVLDSYDKSIRPNAVFLVSLDFSLVDKTTQKKIVDQIHDRLLTIFGLRTLSADNDSYKGSYIGDYNRDFAYHNGTVWPWLLGPFISAYVKVNDYSNEQRKKAFECFLRPMLNVFGDSWDGSINEIFDGSPIYSPRGCINQAWSVAEILRAWVEDIDNKKPEINLNVIR